MESVLQAFQPPLHDPVIVIALAMVVFLGAPVLFERLRLPATVAFIAAGALLGPKGLGWMARDDTIILLGTVGLLYLMFMAAVEIDLHDFDRHRSRSVFFGVLGFLTPLLLGVGVGRMLGYSLATSILLGSMLSSHTLLAYPIASRLGVGKNQAVMVAVGATIITDLLALLVLAAVARSAQGQLSLAFALRLALSIGLFALIVLKGLPIVADRFFKWSCGDGTREYIFVLAALFAAAVLADLAGIEPIIGAFLAGLALNPRLPEGQPLTNRLNFFSDAFFTPFFLFSVGMLVDVRVLAAGPRAFIVMIAMALTVLPAKWIASWLTRRRYGYTMAETITMYGLSVPQAAATLAIALIGFRVKLFDTAVLNATIMIILITSTLGPWLVDRFGRQVALQEQRRPFHPSTEPQRILIPILQPQDTETLIDVGLLLRPAGSREPLLPLAVVPPSGRSTAAAIANAEKMLGHAVMRATGAGVTAVPLTRVAYDLANGIGRGMAESRATTLLVSWSGRRDRRRSILHRRLDQAIARSPQLVLVTHLSAPLKTLQQVLVVLPPFSDRSPGFDDAIHTIKLMASRLSAEVVFYTVRSDLETMKSAVARIRPAVRQRFERVSNWLTLMRELQQHSGEDALVVLLSERRGLVSWQRELDRMPRRLSGFVRNLCIMYPCRAVGGHAHEDHVLVMLAEALRDGRVATGLADIPPEAAIERMLRTEFEQDSVRLPEAMAAVERQMADEPGEIAPGATLLFGRMAQLAAPLLFIGTSPSGIHFPQTAQPACVVVTILVPVDHRTTGAVYLDQLRPVLGNQARLDALARASSPGDIAALFRAEEHGVSGPIATAA